MTEDDNTSTVQLADLSAEKVREENSHVASKMDSLEETIENLRQEKAETEATVSDLEEQVDSLEDEKEEALADQREEFENEIDDLEDELATKEEILNEIQEGQRNELLDRLRAAYATATSQDEEEVDLERFEDKTVDDLQADVEMWEEAAEANTTSSSGARSGREEIDTSVSSRNVDEERKKEVARDMGLESQLDQAEELSPQGFSVNPGEN